MAAEHLLSTAVHDTLPGSYVRPESERPRLAEVVAGARIPVVELGCPDRAAVVAAIGDACRSHGFFQVLDHGIHADLTAAVMAMGRDFFARLPPEEKAKLLYLYSDDPVARKIRPSSTSFDVRKETVRNWRDYLRLHGHLHPLDGFGPEPDWPSSSSSNPPNFKDTMSAYCQEVRELGLRLCLDLEEATYKKQALGEPEQHVAVNLYPEPELTSGSGGLPAHTDPDALTILLMDHDVVASLQVLHGRGKWVAVNPRPGALVVSIGDHLVRALAKRSRGLSIDAALFQRESGGARPRLGGNRTAALEGQGALDPDGAVSVRALLCYSDGLVLPLENITAAGETFTRSSPDAVFLQEVRVDESGGAKACDPIVLGGVGAKATGEDDGRRGSHENSLGILGIMAASLAVTAAVPAAAGAITPAMAFGYAVLMFTGVSMAMASIRGA